jgi:tetratricopeptide (TPR) repeat protein
MIERYGPTDRQMLSDVSELISVFPYFQSAYMLFLKGLHNTADVRFENQLRGLALRIADREALYYYLKKEQFEEEKQSPGTSGSVQQLADTTEHQQTVIDSAKSSTELINEIEKSSEEERSGADSDDHPVIISSIPEIDDQNATIVIVDKETGEIEEKIFYMDPGFSFSEPKDLLEITSEENYDITASAAPEDEFIKASPTKKAIQSELIDKFILANPRIEPVTVRNSLPADDISKPSVEEDDGLLTETLAKIYTRQGYYSRAIDIYEKLSLKFPEKSTYFASQIEKVKELIKK